MTIPCNMPTFPTRKASHIIISAIPDQMPFFPTSFASLRSLQFTIFCKMPILLAVITLSFFVKRPEFTLIWTIFGFVADFLAIIASIERFLERATGTPVLWGAAVEAVVFFSAGAFSGEVSFAVAVVAGNHDIICLWVGYNLILGIKGCGVGVLGD